jgi:hypothetical protein
MKNHKQAQNQRISTILVLLLFSIVLAFSVLTNKSSGRMLVYKVKSRIINTSTN